MHAILPGFPERMLPQHMDSADSTQPCGSLTIQGWLLGEQDRCLQEVTAQIQHLTASLPQALSRDPTQLAPCTLVSTLIMRLQGSLEIQLYAVFFCSSVSFTLQRRRVSLTMT